MNFKNAKNKVSGSITVEGSQNDFNDMIQYETMPSNLNDIEKQIFDLQDKLSKSLWLIGIRLIKIREEYIDQIKYTDFLTYVEEELGIQSRTAKNLMFLSKTMTNEK